MKAYGGSVWFALLVCITIKAKSIEELVRVIGAGKGVGNTKAFDAAVDAYAVYLDALERGAKL